MSNASAFLKGFFGSVKTIQDENRERANNYYDRQLERAQTIGVEKLQARRAKAAQADSVAQKLMGQGNIPPDIIREAAKGGLDGLSQLEEIWKSASSDGIDTDETFWRDVYSVGKEASSTGQPLVPAMGDAAKLASKPPEAPRDRKRSFGDIVFGNDSMERAAQRLSETEVVEGYSAADLLSLEEPTDQPTNGTIDWGAYYEKASESEAAAKEAERLRKKEEKGEDPLSVTERNTIAGEFFKDIDKEAGRRFADEGLSVDSPEYEGRLAKERELVEEERLKELLKVQSPEDVLKIPALKEIHDRIIAKEEEAASQVTPSQGQPTQTKPSGVMEKVNIPGYGVGTFSHMDREGNPVYSTSSGKMISTTISEVSDPNKPAVEESPQGQATQERISSAIASIVAGQEPEGFFIGRGETPPKNIPSPEGGVLKLKQEIDEGYLYGVDGDDSQDILIPKQ